MMTWEKPQDLFVESKLPRLLRYAAEEWLLLFLFWILMYLGPQWLWPGWILCIVGRFQALGVILHDACHNPHLKRSFGLSLLELLTGSPIGTTWNAMKYHHLRHHSWNGSAWDPYFKPELEKGRIQFVSYLIRGCLLVPFWILRPLFALAYFATGREDLYQRLFLQEKSPFVKRYQKEAHESLVAEWRQAAYWLVLLSLAIWQFYPVFWGYFLPLEIAGILNVWRVLIEHRHVEVKNTDVFALEQTTLSRPLSFTRFILFPRNIGYHFAHHVYPTLALEGLPRVTAWLHTEMKKSQG